MHKRQYFGHWKLIICGAHFYLFSSSSPIKCSLGLNHSLYSSFVDIVHICTSLESLFLHFFKMTSLPVTLLKKRVASFIVSIFSVLLLFLSVNFPSSLPLHFFCKVIVLRKLSFSSLLCLHFPQIWFLAFPLLIFFF